MSEAEPLVIDRHQLLAEAHEAYGFVREAWRRDRQNSELAVKFCQASSALSLLLTDCTPPIPNPVKAAAEEAQLAVLNEIAAAFKGVYSRMESTLMDETDGALVFEVNVLYMGSDPDLVNLTLGALGSLEGSFITRKASEALGMARSLTAAGAVVNINVINPAAPAPDGTETTSAPSDSAEASGPAEDVNGAPVEPDEATSAAPGEAPVSVEDERPADEDTDDGAEINADHEAAAELGEE